MATADEVFLAEDCPTLLAGVNSVTFTISGSWEEMRLVFSADEVYTQPFVLISVDGTYTVEPGDADVPLEWLDNPNAGAVGSSNILSLNFQAVSQTDNEAFGFCIEDISIN